MPRKNSRKEYSPDSFYHIYNRGVNKRVIYKDKKDYAVFLNLIKRYLNDVPVKDLKGREYEWLHDKAELVAFCLMPNHFHLLIFQYEKDVISKLLQRVCSAYTTYFNKKYGRLGPLFQDRFKAVYVDSDQYLLHITRYIHLNPKNYKNWEFSSYDYYLKKKKAVWLKPERVLDNFKQGEYEHFIEDYKDYKNSLDGIKVLLANYGE